MHAGVHADAPLGAGARGRGGWRRGGATRRTMATAVPTILRIWCSMKDWPSTTRRTHCRPCTRMLPPVSPVEPDQTTTHASTIKPTHCSPCAGAEGGAALWRAIQHPPSQQQLLCEEVHGRWMKTDLLHAGEVSGLLNERMLGGNRSALAARWLGACFGRKAVWQQRTQTCSSIVPAHLKLRM